jgi:hypothetical protein
MRFMMIVKSSRNCEAGKMPSEELLAAMEKYNKELMQAGVLEDISGLQPTAKGARVKFLGGKTTVIDGPFAETKELIGGYWIIKVKSKEEAIEWAKRVPVEDRDNEEREIEIRQFYEFTDFLPGKAVQEARELEKQLVESRQ